MIVKRIWWAIIAAKGGSLIVPTLRVVTDSLRSAVIVRLTQRVPIPDAERQKPRYHAERGNDEFSVPLCGSIFMLDYRFRGNDGSFIVRLNIVANQVAF